MSRKPVARARQGEDDTRNFREAMIVPCVTGLFGERGFLDRKPLSNRSQSDRGPLLVAVSV
jgi:hypothetical protein